MSTKTLHMSLPFEPSKNHLATITFRWEMSKDLLHGEPTFEVLAHADQPDRIVKFAGWYDLRVIVPEVDWLFWIGFYSGTVFVRNNWQAFFEHPS